ncbi:MAG: hypothetical protein U1B80_06840 [Anaerolineaceae bacterium]|nr:hypothetical protein [Anaerolineaceae bacterium]
MQRIGLFLLCLVGVALVAGLYLSITAQTVAAGVKVQNLETQRVQTLREIANLQSQFAFLSSASAMEKRAYEMGFRPITADDPLYLVIPEYLGRQTAILAPPPSAKSSAQPLIHPSYTLSLLEWFYQGYLNANRSGMGSQP